MVLNLHFRIAELELTVDDKKQEEVAHQSRSRGGLRRRNRRSFSSRVKSPAAWRRWHLEKKASENFQKAFSLEDIHCVHKGIKEDGGGADWTLQLQTPESLSVGPVCETPHLSSAASNCQWTVKTLEESVTSKSWMTRNVFWLEVILLQEKDLMMTIWSDRNLVRLILV